MHEGAPKPDEFKNAVDTVAERADEFLKQEHSFSRRQVVGGLVAAGATGALLNNRPGEELDEDTFFTSPAKAEVRSEELHEPHAESERFSKQQHTFARAYGKLNSRQIQFVADDGAPLGAPVDVAPINGIDPGRLNQDGVIAEAIRVEWLNAARARICAQYPKQTCDINNYIPRQTNSIAMVRLAKERNPELHAETLFDVTYHYGNQKVAEAPGAPTRIDYVRTHIGEGTTLPHNVIRELRHIVPGQAAQESQYDARAVSPVGAKGIFQFMPGTWKDMGFTEAQGKVLPNQVFAASKFFENSHRFFNSVKSSELTTIRQRFFENNDALFTKQFLVPLLINSYNSGPARVATVLSWFLRTYPDAASLERQIGHYPEGFGYDLYATMASTAKQTKAVPGYGKDSSEYVVRSMAFAQLIKERIPEALSVTVEPGAAAV